jgi:hypothetical protein
MVQQGTDEVDLGSSVARRIAVLVGDSRQPNLRGIGSIN